MSYCCGASMIGYIGRILRDGVMVYSVPLLYCPVCCELTVHPSVIDEFELVLEFAHEDGVDEVIFCADITNEVLDEWSEECVSFEMEGDIYRVFQSQIDNALDLLGLAKIIKDESWCIELKERLKILTYRVKCLKEKKEGSVS